MNENLEEFINNPDNIIDIINTINKSFPDIMETYVPTSPHRDPIQYFLTGSCTTYATLLHEIFKGYASYYDCDSHVLVKIGDYYYDVNGENIEPKLENSGYRYCSDKDYGCVLISLGRTDGIDDIIYPELLKIGQNALQDKLTQAKKQSR